MMVKTNVLYEELAKGEVFPVYLLLGEDRGAKDEFVALLQARCFQRSSAFDLSTSYGDEATAEDVVQNLSTYSFFSDRKIVVLRDYDKMNNLKLLAGAIEALPEGTVLVLTSDKKSAEKVIESAVGRSGRSAVFWPMFESEGERWLGRKLGALGIRADPQSLKYIIAVTGTSVGELSGQVEFIANYLEKGEVLTLEKAKKIIAQIYTYTVFDLCNSLYIKPAGELLKIFRLLVANGEDLLKIEYFLSREIRKMLDAHVLREDGYDFTRITKLLGLKKREAERIRFISSKLQGQALRGLYAAIASLDYHIKTNPREVSAAVFERFLLQIGRENL